MSEHEWDMDKRWNVLKTEESNLLNKPRQLTGVEHHLETVSAELALPYIHYMRNIYNLHTIREVETTP